MPFSQRADDEEKDTDDDCEELEKGVDGVGDGEGGVGVDGVGDGAGEVPKIEEKIEDRDETLSDDDVPRQHSAIICGFVIDVAISMPDVPPTRKQAR